MDAGKQNLLSFLSNRQELSIPIYQRKYTWAKKECEQLFNDIYKVGLDENVHSYFIGSIVYLKEKAHISSRVDYITLIDGQQRVTTISLLIAAICKYFKEINDENYFLDLYEYYLIDRRSENKYKLFLTGHDKDTFFKIIDDLNLGHDLIYDENDSISIQSNYEFFINKVNENNVDILIKGLEKLLFIDIALEPGKDNPQLIFESLNSTGKELSKSDLIRNFILMGLETKKQNELYKNYWKDIEEGFRNEDKLFDRFVRDYLTVNLGRIPVEREVYNEFKSFSENFESIEDLLKDLYKYATYFFNIFLEKESDVDLKIAFMSLNKLRFDVTSPFLLNVYDDYKNNRVSKEDFIKIISYVESYVLRRNICGIPTNSMNKTFTTLHNKIDKEQYLDSFIAEIVLLDTYKKFPTNIDVIEALKTKDIYNSRKHIRNHIISSLENYNNKEIVDIEKCTIEHILPQNPNLSDEWINDLGENYKEIQEKYLHTIGNLTLTMYNPELSDNSFEEKKTMKGGFIESKLSLNKSLSTLDKWTEEEIIKRIQDLSEEITEIYPYPEITDEVQKIIDSKTVDNEVYTIGDFEYLQEKTNNRKLYDIISTNIMNFDENITINITKLYISFRRKNKIFVEITPLKSKLRITLTIPVDQLEDPKNKCEDLSGKGKWENGNTRTYIKKEEDIFYLMNLIRQSYMYVK